MGSIEKRSENSYRITVSDGYDINGKKIRKHKSVTIDPKLTPKQVEKELQRLSIEFENQVQTGQVIDNNISLYDFSKKWLLEYVEKQLQPKTLVSYRSELESKILPALGHLKISKIQPIHILEFLNNLLEDGVRLDGKPGSYSNRTVKYQHQILSSIFQTAVYWQILLSNPCERVKPPKKDDLNRKVKYFNEKQAIIFLDSIKCEELKYQLIANLTLYGGLRKGELLGVTWNEIDDKNFTIEINKAIQYLPDTGNFTKTPKNKTSIRTISIPQNVFKLLKEYKVWQNGERKKAGELWDKDWDKTPFIFTQWNGLPMNYDTPYGWFKKFIKRHNKQILENESIPKEAKEKYILPEIPFHGLRHTSATLLIAGKADIKTISSRLGHSQTSTTLNIYAHSLRSSDEKAALTLENLLNKNKNTEVPKQA